MIYSSGHNPLRHFSSDIGQTEITTLEMIRQSLVIETEQVKDGRLEIMDMDRVMGDAEA